jgi:hypothetical protein
MVDQKDYGNSALLPGIVAKVERVRANRNLI